MVFILMLCHLFFTFKLRFIQRYTFKGIKYSFSPKQNGTEKGIGTYAAFAAALGTTIGPGNITGVAVAISGGGPGAVFWMWVCGLLAMPTKYAESYLALKYTQKRGDSEIGGTMVLLGRLGCRRTAVFWSVFCALGGLFMGAAVPSRSLASALPADDWLTGAFLAALLVLTVSCGLSGIARVSGLLVPVMSLGFLIASLAVIALDYRALPDAVGKILSGALSIKSAGAGALGAAVKHGITRGLYSNESGLGSGGILAAESGDKNIGMRALSAMTTTFWDTVVMCAVTGIMFVMSGADAGSDADMTVRGSFSSLPLGDWLLWVSMTLFVFATMIGWYYLAKRAIQYLTCKSGWYDIAFICAAFFGAVLPPALLWRAADTVNFAMLLPSVFVLFKMSGKIENINLYIRHK